MKVIPFKFTFINPIYLIKCPGTTPGHILNTILLLAFFDIINVNSASIT